MKTSSIASINRLPSHERREIIQRLIPPELLDRFHLSPFLVDKDGNDLLKIVGPPGSNSLETWLYHQHGFRDALLYGHLTDTMNGQIHLLLYIMNDPHSPRFDVDVMPDGSSTKFGTGQRNIAAEKAAMQAGLLPGQIRHGLNLLSEARDAFERFIQSLGHELYFVEPLYYHNAIIFERYGFAYQSGRKKMERIQAGFSSGGDLLPKLDGNVFRQPQAKNSIRLRSWAIHDGILEEPFTNVTMYKMIDKPAFVNTTPGVSW